ncbi:MAG: hypothetical protein PHR94_02590 [Methylomonas lenta]|nr:hypothetical protein [Methylomonas lenta]
MEMPRMDGVSFLRNLMRLRPMPVVVNTSRCRSEFAGAGTRCSGFCRQT